MQTVRSFEHGASTRNLIGTANLKDRGYRAASHSIDDIDDMVLKCGMHSVAQHHYNSKAAYMY